MFTIEDASPAVETPSTITAKLAEAVEAAEAAKSNYSQVALDGLEGRASAALVTAAQKELAQAERRVQDITAASAAAEARALRQAEADAVAAKEAAQAAKLEALTALRATAEAWDAIVAQLQAATEAHEKAADALLGGSETTSIERAQMVGTRQAALGIVEHALRRMGGEPKLMPFARGDLLKLVTHIPKAA